MKLTKVIRDAFVRAAMDDVPSIDYNDSIQGVVMAAAIAAMPPAVKKVWADPATRPYINTERRVYGGIIVVIPSVMGHHMVLSAKADKQVETLVRMRENQDHVLAGLRQKLRAAAESCTTRKALAELLPEFEKYLPADQPSAIKTLPAVANVVADFTNAGWPKGGAK